MVSLMNFMTSLDIFYICWQLCGTISYAFLLSLHTIGTFLCLVLLSLRIYWPICLISSLVYFENDPEYLARETVLVFIPLMSFLQQSLFSEVCLFFWRTLLLFFSFISVCLMVFTLVGRVFANGLGERGSIPGRVIPKTQKMVYDTSMLNTQHYKVHIKSKVDQSREWSNVLPLHLSVVALEKGAFRLLSPTISLYLQFFSLKVFYYNYYLTSRSVHILLNTSVSW